MSKENFTIRLTKAERQMLRKLGQLEGSESNAIRRGLKLLMEARGVEIPEGLFTDKEPGNRLPKSAALIASKTSRAGYNTGESVAALTPAF